MNKQRSEAETDFIQWLSASICHGEIMCNCIETLKADESGKIKEFVARQKATVKKINFNQIGFPWTKCADGSTKLGCTTLSVLEVETNEKKRPIKIDILHSFCPFCGVKYE